MRGVPVKIGYSVEDRQARAGSTLRIVVVGLRPAEIRHHAVAEVLRDTSAEALDGLRRRAMVLADNFTPLLGIEMAGDLGRADQIAKQHCQMPSLPSLGLCLKDRANRRGGIEWRCALRAEPGLGWALETALVASVLEGSCAVNAEVRALRIFR